MSVGILIAAISAFTLPQLTSFTSIFILIIVFNICFSPVASLSDSATMSMLGEERAMYGRVRLGGTIGWGIFAQIGGLILAAYGVKTLFYVYATISLINLFVARHLKFGKQEIHAEHEIDRGNVWMLLRSRRWVFFLLSAFFGGLGSISVAAYLAPYLKELGANGDQIGFAFTIATFTELPVFFFGNHLVKRFTSYGLFLIALVLIGVRSLLFGLVDTIPLAILVQAVGGMFFPAMWSAGVAYADEHAPANLKSTAQGIFGAASFGVGSAVGGLVCGILLGRLGGRGMFMVLGIIIFVGLALVETARRLFAEKAAPQTLSAD
jgi:PPP family 3-phenylpropionic acid transporter